MKTQQVGGAQEPEKEAKCCGVVDRESLGSCRTDRCLEGAWREEKKAPGGVRISMDGLRGPGSRVPQDRLVRGAGRARTAWQFQGLPATAPANPPGGSGRTDLGVRSPKPQARRDISGHPKTSALHSPNFSSPASPLLGTSTRRSCRPGVAPFGPAWNRAADPAPGLRDPEFHNLRSPAASLKTPGHRPQRDNSSRFPRRPRSKASFGPQSVTTGIIYSGLDFKSQT